MYYFHAKTQTTNTHTHSHVICFRNDFSFILLLLVLPLVMSYDMNNKSEMEKAKETWYEICGWLRGWKLLCFISMYFKIWNEVRWLTFHWKLPVFHPTTHIVCINQVAQPALESRSCYKLPEPVTTLNIRLLAFPLFTTPLDVSVVGFCYIFIMWVPFSIALESG